MGQEVGLFHQSQSIVSSTSHTRRSHVDVQGSLTFKEAYERTGRVLNGAGVAASDPKVHD